MTTILMITGMCLLHGVGIYLSLYIWWYHFGKIHIEAILISVILGWLSFIGWGICDILSPYQWNNGDTSLKAFHKYITTEAPVYGDN